MGEKLELQYGKVWPIRCCEIIHGRDRYWDSQSIEFVEGRREDPEGVIGSAYEKLDLELEVWLSGKESASSNMVRFICILSKVSVLKVFIMAYLIDWIQASNTATMSFVNKGSSFRQRESSLTTDTKASA